MYAWFTTNRVEGQEPPEWDQCVFHESPALHRKSPDSGERQFKSRA